MASSHVAINHLPVLQGMNHHEDCQAHDFEQAQAHQVDRYRRHRDRASERWLRDRRLGFEQQQPRRDDGHVRRGNIRATPVRRRRIQRSVRTGGGGISGTLTASKSSFTITTSAGQKVTVNKVSTK